MLCSSLPPRGTPRSFQSLTRWSSLAPELSRALLTPAPSLEVLGGAGKKAVKRWEKEYAALA